MKKKFAYLAIGLSLMMVAETAMAGTDTLGTIVGRVKDEIKGIANLLMIVSFISGVGFTLAGILQFKAHKDNPTQIPLSKPFVYLLVGCSLIFMPAIMQTSGQTVFGTTDENASEGETGFGR